MKSVETTSDKYDNGLCSRRAETVYIFPFEFFPC